MHKYLIAFLFLLFVSLYVTRQHSDNSSNAEEPSKNSCGAAAVARDSPKAESDPQKTNWYSPSGNLAYLVFGWPNGVTVWALFLTLFVIAEQTVETRKAAEASLKSAKSAIESIEHAISKERARLKFYLHPLRIQPFNFPPHNGALMLVADLSLMCLGTTPAFVSTSEAVFVKIPKGEAIQQHYPSPLSVPAVIQPSTDRSLPYQALASVSNEEHAGIVDGSIEVHFFGLILYEDIFGRSRNTGLHCVWRWRPENGFATGEWRKEHYVGYDQET